MTVIYQPKGKAREYSELAINLYTGCSHGCKYCYCPLIMRKSLDEWKESPHARTRILQQLETDCRKATDEMKNKELLFSFMSDCYQSDEAALVTRQALLICEQYGFTKVNVLTKAGLRTVNDFDIFKRNPKWKFGSTIIFKDEKLREQWEPGAPSIVSRYEAVKEAYRNNIYTWVSVEPVVNTDEALMIIQDLKPYVNLWKVGKLNHFPKSEARINWKKFYYDAKEKLNGSNVYWKKDLLQYK